MFNVLELSDRADRLNVSDGRLVVLSSDGRECFYCFDDLDAIILATSAVSLSGAVLGECGVHRIPIVVCDNAYRPVAVQTPLCLEGAEHDKMLEAQISAPKTLGKHLWMDIVKAKIKGQNRTLLLERHDDSLSEIHAKVLSGDPDNIEGMASRIYWKSLNVFPRRDRLANDANVLFNYAYTLVFSAFSRYICAAALHPHLGIHHHNQYNPFCLASDLMEPYRACADNAVLELLDMTDDVSLSRPNREFIVRTLYADSVIIDKQRIALFDAIAKTTSSYKKCLLRRTPSSIVIPQWNIEKGRA